MFGKEDRFKGLKITTLRMKGGELEMSLDVELLRKANLPEEDIAKVVKDYDKKEKARVLDETLSWDEVRRLVRKMKEFDTDRDFTISLKREGTEVTMKVR